MFRDTQRLLDLAVGIPVAIALLPVGAAIAAGIALLDSTPVFYAQERVGRRGRTFRLLKFRTMRSIAEPLPGREPLELTRLGPVLRRFHLDELPQAINVLRGDMSLVGPRPERSELVARYREAIEDYDLRHEVRPGITGLAQVSVGDDTSVDNTRAKLRYDLEYIRSRSLRLNLSILLRTLPLVVGINPRSQS